MSKNPFVGLRPYKTSENESFHGREKEVESILSIIQKNKLVFLTGPSGSGKTSIINAGIIPRLRNGFTGQSGSRWSICKFRPGISPVSNLSFSLSNGELVLDKKPQTNDFRNYRNTILEIQDLSIGKIYKDSEISNKKNLLIIIDQLEDLFIFKSLVKNDELSEDELLLNIVSRTIRLFDCSVYFLISLKTEFLKTLSSYTSIQQILTNSQYPIQNIGTNGILKIVNETFTRENITLDNSLLEEIVNKTSKNIGLLPNLQVMFQNFFEFFESSSTITIENSSKIGDIDNVINKKLDIFYDNLSENDQIFYECLIKSLFNIENSDIYSDFRSIEEILDCTDKSHKYFDNFFNKLRDNFQNKFIIIPNLITGIKSNHEVYELNDILYTNYIPSYPNKSEREKIWLDQETDSFNDFQDFYKISENNKLGKTGLLKSPELDLAVKWKNNNYHSKSWSKNYSLNYGQTIDFINKSENFDLKQKKSKELELIKKRKIRRRFTQIVSLFGIIALILAIIAFVEYTEANESEKRAFRDRQIAEEARVKSDSLAEVASENEENALINLDKARIAEKNAKKSAKIAKIAQEKAEISAINALNEAQRAKDSGEVAQQKRKLASQKQRQAELMSESSVLEKEFYSLGLRLEKLMNQEKNSENNSRQIEVIKNGLNKAARYEQNNFELTEKIKETASLYVLLQKSLETLEGKTSYGQTSMLIGRTFDKSGTRAINIYNKKYIAYGGDNGNLNYIVDGEQNLININKERIRSIKFKNENEILIGTFEGKLFIHNIKENKYEKKYDFNNPVSNLFIDKSKNIIVICEKELNILNSSGNELEKQIDVNVTSAHYNDIDDELFIASSNKLFLLKNDLQEIFISNYPKKNLIISSLLFFEDNLVLGTKSGEILFFKKFDENNYSFEEKIDLHYTEITNLFYDKPNKILYSSSYDNQLLKYNIFRGDKLDILDGKNNHLSLEGHEKWIWDIDEFIDNNKRRRLLTIDENGNVISWFMNQKDLIEKVESLLTDTSQNKILK